MLYDGSHPAVVITGASTGIGRAAALKMDEVGWRVYAGIRKTTDGEALQEVASDRLVPIRLDVCDSDSIVAAVDLVRTDMGDAGLVGLVNNAGISMGGPSEFVPMEDFRRQFDVNFFGLVETTQAFLPLLREATGRIVNISSQGGRISAPFLGPYCASKYAVEAISDALRRELEPWNLKVAVVEPGSIDTAIWGKGVDQFAAIDSKLSERARTLYAEGLASLRRRIDDNAARGIPPERVAAAVAHALTAPRPRLRYVVGTDAKLGTWAAKWLGDRAMDVLIRREFSK